MGVAGQARTVAASGETAAPARKGLTRERYRGVFAYPPTPFADDLSLDEPALRSNIRKLVRLGVEGIVLAGSTGEFYTLTGAEHRRIAEILAEETRSTGVVSVIGAQGLNPKEVIDRGRAAMEAGVEAVLAMQPIYNTLKKRELMVFWEQFSKACPDIGIIIYHFDWVRQEYTAETFRQLAHLPNMVGSKEAHFDFRGWRALQGATGMVHMSATDAGWLVEMYRLGGPGVGSVSLTLMPHLEQKALKLCGEGKFEEAERVWALFTEVVGRLRSGMGRPYLAPSELKGWDEYGGAARGKALADAFGFIKAGPPRPPGLPVPPDLCKRLKDYLLARYPEAIPPADFLDTIPPGTKLWPRREKA
jgi:4-hydroxy-tetrahydrodipicolinate synthase